jgi:hypothetical protein
MAFCKTVKMTILLASMVGFSAAQANEPKIESNEIKIEANDSKAAEAVPANSPTEDLKGAIKSSELGKPLEKPVEGPEIASLTKTNPHLHVIEFVLTDKVEGREPKAVVESFKQEDGRAFAFARLSTQKQSQITFIWSREGREQNLFTTNVAASQKFRTFASTKLRPGHWKVQLVSGTEVLAEREFEVKG